MTCHQNPGPDHNHGSGLIIFSTFKCLHSSNTFLNSETDCYKARIGVVL